MYDLDTINSMLADMADAGIVEPMVEPIDELDCHPLDWAEVVGCADDIFDEVYLDDAGNPWYLI